MKLLSFRRRLALFVLTAGLLGAALHFIAFEPASYALYCGLIAAAIAGVCVIRPLRWLGLGTRQRAGVVVALGLSTALAGLFWPSGRAESTGITLLDDWLRESDFRESHSVTVRASTEDVYRALRAVTFGDLRVYGLLMGIRGAVLRQPPNPSLDNMPILEAMSRPRSGFVLLGEQPGREIVFGMAMRAGDLKGRRLTPGEFQQLAQPGWVRVAFNIRVEAVGEVRTQVSTETRILGCDTDSARVFGRYWRFVYPGSALLRHLWLEAIAARAERM